MGQGSKRSVLYSAKVELRRCAVQRHGLELEAVGLAIGPGHGLVDEGDLEERVSGEIALGMQLLDETRERDGIRVSVQGDVPAPPNEDRKRRVPRQVRAQEQRVHEEADHPFELLPVAVGQARPDRDVFLARVAQEKRGESGVEGHEERDAFRPRERLERSRQGGRKGPRLERASEARDGRARMIRRQIEHRLNIGQPALPVGEPFFKRRRVELLPPRGGALRVRDREVVQGGGLSVGERRVEPRELAQQDLDRPAVENDVMDRQDEKVVLAVQAKQAGPEEGAGVQIEAPPSFLASENQGRRETIRSGRALHDDDGQRHGPRRLRDLDRPPAAVGEAPGIQGAARPQRDRDVIGGIARIELMQKPEILLGERERDLLADLGPRRPGGFFRATRAPRPRHAAHGARSAECSRETRPSGAMAESGGVPFSSGSRRSAARVGAR